MNLVHGLHVTVAAKELNCNPLTQNPNQDTSYTMKKEIKINFSYSEHEFLISFYENGLLKKWEIANDSVKLQKLITEYYFPSPDSK